MRKGSKLPAGAQDGDNFTRGMVTLSPDGKAAPYTPIAPVPVVPELQTVRTVRDHDTVYGMKREGDVYDRPTAEAWQLQAQGVVAIIGTPA